MKMGYSSVNFVELDQFVQAQKNLGKAYYNGFNIKCQPTPHCLVVVGVPNQWAGVVGLTDTVPIPHILLERSDPSQHRSEIHFKFFNVAAEVTAEQVARRAPIWQNKYLPNPLPNNHQSADVLLEPPQVLQFTKRTDLKLELKYLEFTELPSQFSVLRIQHSLNAKRVRSPAQTHEFVVAVIAPAVTPLHLSNRQKGGANRQYARNQSLKIEEEIPPRIANILDSARVRRPTKYSGGHDRNKDRQPDRERDRLFCMRFHGPIVPQNLSNLEEYFHGAKASASQKAGVK
jgi:hypothetical protein